MLTLEQRKAAVLQALMRVSDELEKRIKARAQLDAAAKNLAAMTPVQRKVYIDAIKAKLNRIELEIAIAQAKRAAQPRPAVRKDKDMVELQAQELLQRSRARKTAPAACSGPVCGHMRTPTGGRR
jgi:septal ring factor EnvC (AmiA/AmiB activator)